MKDIKIYYKKAIILIGWILVFLSISFFMVGIAITCEVLFTSTDKTVNDIILAFGIAGFLFLPFPFLPKEYRNNFNKNIYRGWDGKIKITKDKIFIVREGFVATLLMLSSREQKRFLEIDILQIKSILFRKAYLTNGYLYFHIEGEEQPLHGYWDKYRFIGNRYTVGFTLFSNRRFEECKEALEKIILEQKERQSSNTYILEEENNKLKKYDFRDDVNQLKFVPKCENCGAKHIVKRGKLYICAYCNSTLFFE